MTTEIFTHVGPWDTSTREVPALRFLEEYVAEVDAIDISGPHHDWYAQSARLYNCDGKVYDGGAAIWTWMAGLFGQFGRVQHHIKLLRLFHPSPGEDCPQDKAQWVVIETDAAFSSKGQLGAEKTVIIPRCLMFLVGGAEFGGQGTDGLQILEAKISWDSGMLQQL